MSSRFIWMFKFVLFLALRLDPFIHLCPAVMFTGGSNTACCGASDSAQHLIQLKYSIFPNYYGCVIDNKWYKFKACLNRGFEVMSPRWNGFVLHCRKVVAMLEELVWNVMFHITGRQTSRLGFPYIIEQWSTESGVSIAGRWRNGYFFCFIFFFRIRSGFFCIEYLVPFLSLHAVFLIYCAEPMTMK